LRAAVVGIAGHGLSPEERLLFARLPPAGVILFSRNIAEPAQIRALARELRALVPGPLLLFVDQEGGRVQRLGPPHWPRLPPATAVGDLAARDPAAGVEAAALFAAAVAATVLDAGLDVACAPVADVRTAGGTGALGDRAFSDDPRLVARLARIFARTLDAFGVGAVAKHAPGHGRAREDSHVMLPRVDVPRAELEARDLVPFRALADCPFVMTAHVLYPALDPERPASLSPHVHRLLRGAWGLRGLVVSDDLAMGALEGPPGRRAGAARAAGADLALYCPGDPEGNEAVLEAAGELAPEVKARLVRLLAGWTARRRPLPAAAITAELERRLSC